MVDLIQESQEYMDILLNKPEGREGRQYLKSRGIKVETALYWQLGYSPNNYIPQIYRGNPEYKVWKKMHGRITVPVFDQNGEMVSISGRLVLKLDKPKYDHYSFPTRKILFGLYQNRNDIRLSNRMIITEGQMDVISSWQSGLRIVTSSFGAHCSLDHFAIAARYTSKLDVLYDEDNAGKMGTDAIQEFPTWGDLTVNLKRGIFPKGDDLDSWIRKHNVEQLFKLLDKNKNDLLQEKLQKIRASNV